MNRGVASATTVCFVHGRDSGPWGTKISALAAVARRRALAVESPDFRGQAPGVRVRGLLEWCAGCRGTPVLVGSSLGAHVALAAAAAGQPVAGVFALAPAVYMPGHERETPPPPGCPLVMVHGWNDAIVPVDNAIRYAREAGATLHLFDGDHRLIDRLADVERCFAAFLDDVVPPQAVDGPEPDAQR